MDLKKYLKTLFGKIEGAKFIDYSEISSYKKEGARIGKGGNAVVYEIQLNSFDLLKKEETEKKYALKVLNDCNF